MAVDGQVLGLAPPRRLRRAGRRGHRSAHRHRRCLDAAWPDRPTLPAAPVYEHRAPQATPARADKLARVRDAMARHGRHAPLRLHRRRRRLAHQPARQRRRTTTRCSWRTCCSTPRAPRCSSAPASSSAPLRADSLPTACRLAPYAAAAAALAGLSAKARLLLDPKRITLGLREQVGGGCDVVEAINPSTLLKSRKTAERSRLRARGDGRGRRRDVRVLCLVRGRAGPRRALAELTSTSSLTAARARRAGFVGLSFSDHRRLRRQRRDAALPRHAAVACACIEGDGLLLIDSGAQYLGGTTDITRVWPIGTPSAAMKRDYTLVLKGTMALSRARFPRGTLSPMLDAIARAPLWAEGPRFRPRHRPRRGLLPERARRPAEHQPHDPRSAHGDGAGHDHLDRAGRLPPRAVGRAHREPGAQRAGGHARGRPLRRDARVRDADAVPDRHALHRSLPCCAPTKSTGSTPTTPRCASGWRRACKVPRWPGCSGAACRFERRGMPLQRWASTWAAPRSRPCCCRRPAMSSGAGAWPRRPATTPARCRPSPRWWRRRAPQPVATSAWASARRAA